MYKNLYINIIYIYIYIIKNIIDIFIYKNVLIYIYNFVGAKRDSVEGVILVGLKGFFCSGL